MLKRKKILIPLIVVILAAGAFEYKSSKKPPVVHLKIAGLTYVLPTPFLLNLSDGEYAKLTVGLELAPGQTDGVTAATAGNAPASDGIGTMPEEPEIRAIVTNVITNSSSESLINDASRAKIEQEILTQILQNTDDKVAKVIFTDLAVQ